MAAEAACATCGVALRDGGHPTPLGARVCRHCQEAATGASAACLAGNGIPGTLAGPGLLRWVAETLHPERRRARLAEESSAGGADAHD